MSIPNSVRSTENDVVSCSTGEDIVVRIVELDPFVKAVFLFVVVGKIVGGGMDSVEIINPKFRLIVVISDSSCDTLLFH